MGARVCVVDVPGLSRELLAYVPAGSALGKWLSGRKPAGLTPTFPAVTCSVQASLTTGLPPAANGVVANGLPTFRFPQDQALVDASNFASYRRQVSFWEQSNQFVEAPRFWQDAAGRSKYKTALLFFQNSMPGFAGTPKPAADVVLTPKPDHGPDGKLVSLCWSEPPDLVAQLFKELGPFPLMNYWGPMAGIASSQWIARSAAWVWDKLAPRLQLTYLPHLDYDLQRFGPGSPQAKKAVEDVSAALEPLAAAVLADGGKLVLLSEYAMTDVSHSVQPNRLLAEAGLLTTTPSPDGKIVDYDRSPAFAMVDHQIAHVYTRDAAAKERAHALFAGHPHVTVAAPESLGVGHRRAGDWVLLASPDAWFDYRWWAEPADVPAFARMVDIHRKPGYDPLELFWDRAANGTSQNASLVRGSHGLNTAGQAVLVSDEEPNGTTELTQVGALIERLLA